MRLAIISDLHDNLPNLEKCLSWCRQNKVVKIICCGDVGNIDTLEYLSLNFPGEIFLVTGNAETYSHKDLQALTNLRSCGEIGYLKLEGISLGFCHKNEAISRLKKAAEAPLDFIFYGHSHKPWLEKSGNTFLANPGNLANIFYPPTFAVLDTKEKRLELKILASLSS